MIEGIYTIRMAGQPDADLLAEMGARGFSDTFSRDNNPDDMAEYLRLNFSPEKQSAELATAGSHFLIMENSGTAMGYARLSDDLSDPCLDEAQDWSPLHKMELARFYLMPEWKGRRLGDVLMEACLEKAKELGVQAVWLGYGSATNAPLLFICAGDSGRLERTAFCSEPTCKPIM